MNYWSEASFCQVEFSSLFFNLQNSHVIVLLSHVQNPQGLPALPQPAPILGHRVQWPHQQHILAAGTAVPVSGLRETRGQEKYES